MVRESRKKRGEKTSRGVDVLSMLQARVTVSNFVILTMYLTFQIPSIIHTNSFSMLGLECPLQEKESRSFVPRRH